MLNYRNLLLAASVTLAIIGYQSAGAQDRSGMALDADGIEPPDIGIAYEIPVNSVIAGEPSFECPELTALLADADGLEPPDIGVAYYIGKPFDVAAKRQDNTSQ